MTEMTVKTWHKKMLGFLCVALPLITCGCKEDEPVNSLAVSRTEVAFASEGGTATLLLQTDAPEWRIQNPADWITVSPTMGTESSAQITLTVTSKKAEARSETLTIVAGNATPLEVTVSQTAAEFLYTLSSNFTALNFKKGGNALQIDVTTDAPQWQIGSDASWLQFSPASAGPGTTKVTVTATGNESSEERTANIQITAAYTPTIQIAASQIGEYYPSYNTSPLPPDATGMGSTAMEIYNRMTLGWNIGNTLEAIGGETAWGNPRITGALLDLVKANGFNSIRIPCSWNQYLSSPATAEISEAWLNRVKEVVQLCVERDLYVILNIHWDGGWLENNVTPAFQEENNAKQKAFWEQIATHLRDFDEHLIFAGTNEPNVENATQMAVLKSYLQTFIDAVRSTGGKNSHRVLVIQGPSTDIGKTNELMTSLPTDNIANKLMMEVHYYTPYQFCLMSEDASWGKMHYYWGTGYLSATDTDRNSNANGEAEVDANFAKVKQQFMDKGIPVILGEYAVVRRTTLTGDNLKLHLDSRAYYLKYVTKKAKENGMIPFYWDAGGMGNLGSALFNRQNNTVFDQQALDAILEALE